jgi:hypothetical protein
MEYLPEEREIQFELTKNNAAIVGYNPQALARCLIAVNSLNLQFSKDRKDIVEYNDAVGNCLCPAIYLLECEAFYIELPLTVEKLDELPDLVVNSIVDSVIEDFAILTKPYERIN